MIMIIWSSRRDVPKQVREDLLAHMGAGTDISLVERISALFAYMGAVGARDDVIGALTDLLRRDHGVGMDFTVKDALVRMQVGARVWPSEVVSCGCRPLEGSGAPSRTASSIPTPKLHLTPSTPWFLHPACRAERSCAGGGDGAGQVRFCHGAAYKSVSFLSPVDLMVHCHAPMCVSSVSPVDLVLHCPGPVCVSSAYPVDLVLHCPLFEGVATRAFGSGQSWPWARWTR
jgi:hypothetical protein